MRALGACGLVDCILDFVWFFHRISDYSIALQWLLILLLVHFLLWCEEWWLRNNCVMDVADHVTIVSCVTPFFSKNSPLASTRHKNYHQDEDIFRTTPLWKQQRSIETSTMLQWTALYSMLFRLICTAIATPLRSETYRVIHHRYNFLPHRISYHRVINFPLSMSSNRALLL